ncbi:flavodoxin and radical SAM domain-containing protein [Saccharata proteae CBS 121410]|uniref:tRNA 4-demethylwyosine synthase (AdoMet-dependent) n=1 Tax=Saccharata proteae CBS 121410 TaxID=1314787 RepID=A0A9P4HLI8_9PEZI|nr:flavodoxin and radical SAM domain-containing protein [Saccharata proteae CBS 121410]
MPSQQWLFDLPGQILALWHTHRTPILLAVVCLVALIRLAQHLHRRNANKQKISASPIPGSPTTSEKKVEDIAARWKLEEPVAELEKTKPLDDDHLEDITVAQPPLVQSRPGPKKVTGTKLPRQAGKRAASFDAARDQVQPLVFFSSLGGTTEAYAKKLVSEVGDWIDALDTGSNSKPLKPLLHDLNEIDYDDYFISAPKGESHIKYFYFVIIPTYNIDTTLDNFLEHLQETHHDFRIDTAPLSGILGYAVFGFGDREGWPTEEEGFCSQGKDVDKWLAKLTGRKRAFPLGIGDVKSDAQERLEEWRLGVQEVLLDVASGKGLGEGVPGSGDSVESDEEDVDEEDDEDESTAPKVNRKSNPGARADDLEDLGKLVREEDVQTEPSESAPLEVDFTTYKKPSKPTPAAPKEMVPKTSPTYSALTKQGYTIVGSHSGVKICRWTKSALRGRGSCYKFSFYGIKSHLCMETTPSLSCSNKCVFCWRHGTNPVGTTWRWKVDPPDMIFKGVTEGHYKKIKMMRGVPGVRAERFAEAMRIRHCALSLVGEPIFYPHINEFTAMLHAEHISSFLVCNAQHPAQLAALKPVTQLYVSIDASDKETLRKIDRPLHRDFWERFEACLDILRAKRFEQRTVFRLTLVKGFNVDEEAKGYADLVERGLPCFVEVKGVTYCGTSTSAAAGLTMQNVPFYEEVAAFVVALNKELEVRGLEYGIAAEHAHSCCILLASKRFRRQVDGEWKWCTLIDYEAFFRCLESGEAFKPEDYMGEPTPEWALWGNGGFDPMDERVYRKGKKKGMSKEEVEKVEGEGRVKEVVEI